MTLSDRNVRPTYPQRAFIVLHLAIAAERVGTLVARETIVQAALSTILPALKIDAAEVETALDTPLAEYLGITPTGL